MRFLNTIFVALSTLLALAFAQDGGNPINYPTAGSQVQPGDTVTITWDPTTPGTVSLVLRRGPSENLVDVDTIVTDTENDGQYEWVVPDNLVQGSDYAIEITWTTGNNYSAKFTVNSSVTASETATRTTTAPTGQRNATVTATDISTMPTISGNHTTTKRPTTKPTSLETISSMEPTDKKNKPTNTATPTGKNSSETTAKATTSGTGVPDSSSVVNTVSSVLALVIAGIWALAL